MTKTQVTPHLFVHDPDLRTDHKGRRYCRCGVVELAGDPRHTLPATAGPDARELAAHEGGANG